MNQLRRGLEILKHLNDNGFEGFLIGGAVRDFLLGKPMKDIDITTNATPEEIANLFEKVSLENASFLSCRIFIDNEVYEVTSYRKDIAYYDHRHPITELAKSLKDDVLRRDFTINGIAMNADQQIIDYVDGQRDLERQLIRTIGDPKVRFEEDALRVLRGLDFASRLNFDLDLEIINTFEEDYIVKLKEEYVISMITKIMANPYSKGLEYIKEYQLLRGFPFYQVICEEALKYQESDGFTLYACRHGFLPANLKISKNKRWNAMTISRLVRNHFSNAVLFEIDMKYWMKALRFYNKINNQNLTIEELKYRYDHLPIHNVKEIQFDFHQLPAHQRGWMISKVIHALLDAEIQNQNEDILKWIRTCEE